MTATDYSIRPIVADDYDALVELWSASALPFQPNGRESRDAILRHLQQFTGFSFVAIAGEQLVGTVLGTHDGRKGWINRLAVRPEFRRRGVAAALVRTCDAALRKQGIEIVAALVEVENDASASLFRKLGYSDAIEVRYFRKVSHPQV